MTPLDGLTGGEGAEAERDASGRDALGAPPWRQRFLAPSFTFPAWASDQPDRLVYATNTSGPWHVYAREGGAVRQVSHDPGSHRYAISPDGETIFWFRDDDRDEAGVWLAEPFSGGRVRPLVTGAGPAFSSGMVVGAGGRFAAGVAEGGLFGLRLGRVNGPAQRVVSQKAWLHVESMSADAAFVAVLHAEDDLLPALRVVDLRRRETTAELRDSPGCGLYAPVFSPVRGDLRVAFIHDHTGVERPGLWDPVSGERRDLEVALPGDIEVVEWWPGAEALLLTHVWRGCKELHRLHIADGRCEAVPTVEGSVGTAKVRPDGSVWYQWSSAEAPPTIRSTAGAEVPLHHRDELMPVGAPCHPWSFTNPSGQRVHGLYVLPPGRGPHPTVMLVHGGPHQHDIDTWNPTAQAFVDHGWVVALVNYRGSTGYGHDWLHATRGDPGRPEVEDILAGRAALVDAGHADPSRVMVAGGSWGGYVALLAAGLAPEAWCAVASIAPIADWVTAYTEQSPPIRALARSMFGGDPETAPQLYVDRSPVTHAAKIRVPILLMANENDTRCPPGQLRVFAEAVQRAGGNLEMELAGTGHGAHGVHERIEQVRKLLRFGAQHVTGVLSPQD